MSGCLPVWFRGSYRRYGLFRSFRKFCCALIQSDHSANRFKLFVQSRPRDLIEKTLFLGPRRLEPIFG
jgi:hypothetical protein